MALDFNKYAATGNQYLNRLAQELEIPQQQAEAGRILRAVLRTLRNHLTVEESLDLLSQLPMALKGVYVDGWKLNREARRPKHVEEFLKEVMQEDGLSGKHDFHGTTYAKFAVGAVFRSLQEYVSEGEYRDVLAVLPQEIREFIQGSLAGKSGL